MIIYDLIFNTLKNSGIDVYAPNTHKGDCITPYVVVKRVTAGRFQRYSTQIVYYDLLCYAKNYTSCLPLVEKVKTAMKGADFNVRPGIIFHVTLLSVILLLYCEVSLVAFPEPSVKS